jgi:hypothetical protein
VSPPARGQAARSTDRRADDPAASRTGAASRLVGLPRPVARRRRLCGDRPCEPGQASCADMDGSCAEDRGTWGELSSPRSDSPRVSHFLR